MPEKKFKAKICQCCGQAENYMLGMDKGSAEIVLSILSRISEKEINEIHPSRELEMTGDKKWQITNLSRPRFHGLIAFVKDKPGYYCLTRKAGLFLKGEPIPKYAIVSKVTGHNEGYWGDETVTLRELLTSGITWSGYEKQMIDKLYSEQTNSLFDDIR